MGTGFNWGQGGYRELAEIDKAYNNATPEQLKNFIGMLDGGDRFFDALDRALPISPEAQAFLPQTDRNWFGKDGESMWAGNSELSGWEIHEVVKRTARAVASLLVAGAGPVQHWCRCGFPLFEIAIAWPGAGDVASVEKPGAGATGGISVWMATPFNSGYPSSYERGHGAGYSDSSPYDQAVAKAHLVLADSAKTPRGVNEAMGQVALTYELPGPAFPRQLRRLGPDLKRATTATPYTDSAGVFANAGVNVDLGGPDPGGPRGPGVVIGIKI